MRFSDDKVVPREQMIAGNHLDSSQLRFVETLSILYFLFVLSYKIQNTRQAVTVRQFGIKLSNVN